MIRKTCGFQKKSDDLTSSQLAQLTGLNDGNCRRTVLELEQLNVLITQPGHYGKRIVLNKDYESWRVKTTHTRNTHQETLPRNNHHKPEVVKQTVFNQHQKIVVVVKI